MSIDIICDRLEFLQNLLSFGNNFLVLEDASVMVKVDCRRLSRVLVVNALRVGVTFSECLEGSNGL